MPIYRPVGGRPTAATRPCAAAPRRSSQSASRYAPASIPAIPHKMGRFPRPREAKAQELELGRNVCALAQAYQPA